VVEYDGMGSGLSQELPKEVKLMLEQDGGGGRDKAVAFAVEELGLITSNLAKTLKVEGFHMFGHGFGAEVTCRPYPYSTLGLGFEDKIHVWTRASMCRRKK
jgi:hypothetical protein